MALGSGLASFSLHRARSDQSITIASLQQESSLAGFGIGQGTPGDVDPETAARQHLATALASESAPDATAPSPGGLSLEFRSLGTETSALTGTKSVKFRQSYNKVPVYGSLVTVELDENNELIGINSSLGDPEGVSPVAAIAPAEALNKIASLGGNPDANAVGRLIFYFDRNSETPSWRLCYLFEDIPLAEGVAPDQGDAQGGEGPFGLVPIEQDFIVDAHSGELIERLPRSADASVSAPDELNAPRQFSVSPALAPAGTAVMIDAGLKIETFDLGLHDLETDLAARTLCANPPPPWSKGAVSAHANAAEVVYFLRTVLLRDGVDGKGGTLHSTINCTYSRHQPGPEWHNAAWGQGQMFYGQRRVGGTLVSTAADLDVVAHEIVHGVNQSTANLQYLAESGALNESYSDILGVIVANAANPNPLIWDFRIGKTFRGTGVPLRDLADPTLHGQPDHMDDYRRRPLTAAGDWGGVHTNSGIHNKAGHLIITARDADGNALFRPTELATMFYIALKEHLSRTSVFADSRRAVETATLSLFRNESQADIDARRQAVNAAFDAVGIA